MDLIDRQAAIDALDKLSLGETDAIKLYFRMNDYLKRMPSADVQPVRHGYWDHDESGATICTACGEYTFDDGTYHMIWHTDYCPHCGARMDYKHGEQKND